MGMPRERISITQLLSGPPEGGPVCTEEFGLRAYRERKLAADASQIRATRDIAPGPRPSASPSSGLRLNEGNAEYRKLDFRTKLRIRTGSEPCPRPPIGPVRSAPPRPFRGLRPGSRSASSWLRG